MKKFIKSETKLLFEAAGDIRLSNLIILLSIPVLSTLSWYFASPDFYYGIFTSNSFSVNIIEEIKPVLFWFGLDAFFFMIIPVLIIVYLFRDKLRNYGFKKGDSKTGLGYFAISLVIILPLIYLTASSSEFTNIYPLLKSARDNWVVFVIFELVLLLYVASWEFMWRGYVLFGLEKDFGLYSILIQTIPFVILHNGKPFFETFSAILGGLFLGYIALRTRSFFYGVLIHFSLISLLDFISVLKYRIAESIGLF